MGQNQFLTIERNNRMKSFLYTFSSTVESGNENNKTSTNEIFIVSTFISNKLSAFIFNRHNKILQ